MLLIPFVENAFKHGSLIDGYLTIEIDVELIENQLEFSIKNTVVSAEIDKNENGIGLENIKKRLNLLYKNNYLLNIATEENWFVVDLKIVNINNLKNE